MPASQDVLNAFQTYQRARVTFVQTVADLSKQGAAAVDLMQNAGVMNLLRPLLSDNVPSIAQGASVTLGRLANSSEKMALSIVRNGILPELVNSLKSDNIYHKKSASYVLRTIAKHNADLGRFVVDAKAVPELKKCLEHIDPTVKEAACWALDYIAQHNAALAQIVVDEDVVPLLVLCIQEPEVTLKRIAASCMSNIAKHSPELAQKVLDSRCLPHFGTLLDNVDTGRRDVVDTKLKRQICACIAHIVKHSEANAQQIVDAKLLPLIMDCLVHADDAGSDALLSKNASVVLREIANQSLELATIVVDHGGIDRLVTHAEQFEQDVRLPAVAALGFIAGVSPELATQVIEAGAVQILHHALVKDVNQPCKAACAWTLGQIGQHSADHVVIMGEENVYRNLVKLMQSKSSSPDLQLKARKGLKRMLSQVADIKALEPLLSDAPPKVQKYVLRQLAETLPTNTEQQKAFVASGSLAYVQKLNQDADGKLQEHIETLNAIFPPDVVEYYTPGYAEQLLETHFGDDDEEH